MENEELKNENVEQAEITKEPKKEKKMDKNKQLEELNQKTKLLEEEVLRAKADLINYRKRKDEEVSMLLKYASKDLILSLLKIIDDFELVINKDDISNDVKTYLEGFKLIYNNLKTILEANEVKEIEALGKEFDPMYHQSVSTKKDDTKEQGIVLEVFKKGYTYKDKILRPAMVIINE